MNKKVFKFMGFLLPCLLIYACTEILRKPQGSESQASDFSAEEARAFFENNANALNPLNFVTDPAATRSMLENEVNLSPIWKDAVAYNTARVSIVEIPLYSGTFMKALQKRIYQQRKIYHEYTSFDRKLIIARGKDEKIVMFLVTLLPDPNSDSGSLAEFRYLGGTRFTGLVLCSTLEGRFVEGYRYYNGHKTVRVHVMLKSEFEKTELAPEKYEKFRLYESHTVTRGGYTFYEWGGGDDGDDGEGDGICWVCGNQGLSGGCFSCGRVSDIPEVVVIYCRRCQQPEDECICCPVCNDYPCKCCSTCYSYPCICDKTCDYCHSYPCTCHFCEYCHSRHCWGECQNVTPELEDPDNECLGEKCLECGGIIPGTAPASRSGDPKCPPCRCPRCPVCNKKNCRTPHADCSDPKAAYNKLVTKNNFDVFSHLRDTTIGTQHKPSFQEYLNKIKSRPDLEHSVTLNYADDSGIYWLDDLNSGTADQTMNKISAGASVACIHNHPSSGMQPPSAQDIMTAAEFAETGTLFKYLYVYIDGKVYALYIEDRQKAIAFAKANRNSVDPVTHKFKGGTKLNIDWNKAENYIFQYLANNTIKMEYIIAYILKNNNSGIKLLQKSQGEDSFKVLDVKEAIGDYIMPIECK